MLGTSDTLTVRADLVLLAGLGANRSDADDLLAFSSLVRAINESAGEKNIPQRIKAKFPAGKPITAYGDERLKDIDRWLSREFDIPLARVIGICGQSERETHYVTS